MARSTDGSNKSKFIREMMEADNNVEFAAIEAAYREAGNTDELNRTLYYQQRKKMGLSTPRKGKGRGKGRPKGKPGRKPAAMVAAGAAPEAAATPVVRRGAGRPPRSTSGYHAIEAGLDDLIHHAIPLNNQTLLNHLRDARRIVIKTIG